MADLIPDIAFPAGQICQTSSALAEVLVSWEMVLKRCYCFSQTDGWYGESLAGYIFVYYILKQLRGVILAIGIGYVGFSIRKC